MATNDRILYQAVATSIMPPPRDVDNHLDYDPDDQEPYTDDMAEREESALVRAIIAAKFPMSHAEAGRLGGLATFAKYGREHMVAIARKGGEAYNQKYVGGGLGGPIKPRKDVYDDTELPY